MSRPAALTIALSLTLAASLAVGGCGKKSPPAAGRSDAAPRPSASPEPSPTSTDTTSDGDTEDGSRPAAPPPVREDGTVYAEATLMGTRVSMNVWLEREQDANQAGAAIRAAFAEIARVEQIASEWREDSEISRFTRNPAGTWVEVSPELLELLERSAAISQKTEGHFDVTFHGVGQLWSFEADSTPPTRAAIEKQLPLVDWKHIELDAERGRARLAKGGVKIGFGAIAKGYAVDRAADMLRERGFSHFIVEGGGDTYVSGKKDGRPWQVGIQDPDRRGALGSLAATNEAVVTSGNYERYFEHEGTRYAHIIDPRTGWPVPLDQSPSSVSLVADNATDADALCTAVMVMGTKKGLAWVEAHDGVEAIFVEGGVDGPAKLVVSSGLESRFVPFETD